MRYQIWNKMDNIITPSGAQFTAKEWGDRYPWSKLPGVKMVITTGPINGGCALEYGAMVERAKKSGVAITEAMTDVEVLAAACVGLLTGLWGWMGWLVAGWVFLMVLDYLTGTAAACKEGSWSSAHAREGIWHKAGMIVVVLVAAGADLLIEIVLLNLPVLALPVEYPGLICPVVLVWYAVTELGSITENAVHMGAPVPPWLVRLLAVSKGVVDQAGEALGGKEDGHE